MTVLIHKSRNPLQQGNYQTIMIATHSPNFMAWRLKEIHAPGQARLRGAFSTTNHIFPSCSSMGQAKGQRSNYMDAFSIYSRPFILYHGTPPTTIPCTQNSLWHDVDYVAWYEQVLEWVSHPWSLSEVITNTICVKQGCKLSSTLFGLCINEVADCIMHGDYEGINILDTPIHILLYADNIVLISESHTSLQHHPRWFSIKKGLQYTYQRHKAMIFKTSALTHGKLYSPYQVGKLK